MTTLHEKLQETTAFIKGSGVGEVEFGLILGSGLGELADEIENPIVLPYNDIPHFPVFDSGRSCRTIGLWNISWEKSLSDARTIPLL